MGNPRKAQKRKKAAQAASAKFEAGRKGREASAEDAKERNRLTADQLDATIEATSAMIRQTKKSNASKPEKLFPPHK
jgi:hypothetical protein